MSELQRQGCPFPNLPIDFMGSQLLTPQDLESILPSLHSIHRHRRANSGTEPHAKDFGLLAFQKFAQIGPTQAASRVPSPSLWLRTLSNAVAVHAFSTGGTSSLMADVELPPDARLEIGRFPGLAAYVREIGDACSAFSNAQPSHIALGHYAWEIFHRLRYELICLAGVPECFQGQKWSYIHSELQLSSKALLRLRSYLTDLCDWATETETDTAIDFVGAKYLLKPGESWIGDGSKQWNHLGWVIYSLIQTGHTHVVLLLALWTICSQAQVETQMQGITYPSPLAKHWKEILSNLP